MRWFTRILAAIKRFFTRKKTVVLCCGKRMKLLEVGGDLVEDDLEDGEAFIEMVYESQCKNCGCIYHFAVSKPL